jgi:hypothetical protein
MFRQRIALNYFRLMRNQFVNNCWITDVSSKERIELFSFDQESVRGTLIGLLMFRQRIALNYFRLMKNQFMNNCWITDVSLKERMELFSFDEESVCE